MSSPAAGPPAPPPQVSPDGKWYWDGSQWRPFAVHEAIFPTWQSVGAGLPPETAGQARRIPTPPPVQQRARPQAAAPVLRRPAAQAAPQMEAPLWQPAGAGTGTNRYLYSAAAVLALVVVAVVLNSMGAIRFPWQQSPPEQVTAKQAPTPGARSDAARADFMINTVLGPQLTTLGDSVAVVRGSCPAGMTASCEDGLVEVDNNVTAILPVIDHQTVPACIAPQIVQLRADLVKLDAGAQLGAKGFKDNRAAEVSSGASQVSSVFGRVQADNAAAAAAAKGCDTQLVGP